LDLHVHGNHHLGVANASEDCKQVGGEGTVRPVQDDKKAEEDGHDGVQGDLDLSIGLLARVSESIDTNENDDNKVVNDSVIHVDRARPEAGEGVVLLIQPDVVDLMHKLDLLLLDSLLVVLRVDLVFVDDLPKVHVVADGEDESKDFGSLHGVVDIDTILITGCDLILDSLSICPELASGWPGDVEQAWNEHDLHEPEPDPVDIAWIDSLRVVRNSVSHPLRGVENKGEEVEHDCDTVPNDQGCLDFFKVLGELVVLVLIEDMETENESTEQPCDELSEHTRPALVVEEK